MHALSYLNRLFCWLDIPFRRRARAQEGALAIEFALIAPVLMIFLMGLFETGRLYFVRGSMRYAVNEAGRYAMVNTTATNAVIEQRVRDNLIGISPESATPTVTDQIIGGKTYKRIVLTHSFSTIVGSMVSWPTISLNIESAVPILP